MRIFHSPADYEVGKHLSAGSGAEPPPKLDLMNF